MKNKKNIFLSALFSAVLLMNAGCSEKNKNSGENIKKTDKVSNKKEISKMTVNKGDSVKISYEGRLESGEVFDKSADDQPLAFTVGSGQIIPGLDRAMEGMEVNQEKEVAIEPADAYGERNEDMMQDVLRSKLPENLEPEVGMVLQTQTPSGQAMPVAIVAVGDETVKIDFNHPLAGKKLIFKVKLIELN